jgi:hypothetical protein
MANVRAVLSDLIAERARIDRAIQSLQALNPAPVAAVQTQTKPRTARRRRGPNAFGAVPKAVARYLTENPGSHQIGEITDGIALYGINGPRSTRYINVTSALKRFEAKGEVVRVGKSWERALVPA